jgi:predicted acylesterase/phospholipase RssA
VTAPQLPSVYLAAHPLFSGVSAGALGALDTAARWVLLAGGGALFEQGDEPDALYVLVRGTLHVVVHDAAGESHSVEYLGAGALVGELGVLLDEPRSATLRAVRDAELLQVPRAAFLRLLETEPALGVAVSRLLGQRLKRTTKQPRVRPRVGTVALLPVDGHPVPPAFVRSLLDALSGAGGTPSHLSSASIEREIGAGASAIDRGDPGDSRILELCDELERRHSLVIYEGGPVESAWTRRCLRQADLVLLIADAAGAPAAGDLERRAIDGRPPGSIELVLLHRNDAPPAGTIEWLRHRPGVGHHHVHLGRPESRERLARSVTGTAAGLVLSGGGARGFAHIGVIRALHEAAIAIDVVGGSSMGAIVAAQHAAGFGIDEMIELNRRAFSGSDVSDLTVPAVALRRGRSTVRRLKAMFGERQIEDLPLRYFCTTSDLTRARVVVHDRGPLWLWTRASCSIPGLAPPIPSRGSLLVDGGLLNNLPADVMRQRCSGAVMAVNVTPTVDLTTDSPLVADMSGWPHLWRMLAGGPGQRPFPNIAQILSRTAFVGSVRDAQQQARHADLYLEPALEGIGMGDFDAIDRIVEAGYRHAVVRIAAWLECAGAPAAPLGTKGS